MSAYKAVVIAKCYCVAKRRALPHPLESINVGRGASHANILSAVMFQKIYFMQILLDNILLHVGQNKYVMGRCVKQAFFRVGALVVHWS